MDNSLVPILVALSALLVTVLILVVMDNSLVQMVPVKQPMYKLQS